MSRRRFRASRFRLYVDRAPTFFLTLALSFLPTILCHAPEEGHIFLAQLEADVIRADSAASGDHYVKPHFF